MKHIVKVLVAGAFLATYLVASPTENPKTVTAETNSSIKQDVKKCGASKCGDAKKAPVVKKSTGKCGAGKCGGGK